MLDEENLYNDEDELEEQNENYAGFSIVDESGEEVKPAAKKEEEEEIPTIATPIPLNEQTVIIDNAAALLPPIGEILVIKLDETSGEVHFDNEKIGNFKPAFIAKLYTERKGKYVQCVMHADTAPVMVKMLFSDTSKKGYIKI